MTNELTLDKKADTRRLDEMAQGLLGTPMDRPEGVLKVTGKAIYADEERPSNLAYGYLVRATGPIGRIVSTNKDEIAKMPGVVAVIEEADLPRNSVQGATPTAAPTRGDRIDYIGQPLALVVADGFEEARHAAQAMTAVMEADTGLHFDPEAPGASIETPEAKQASQGDLDAAMASAAFTLDEEYHTSSMHSAAMEPHATIAEWKDGKLTMRGAYQMLKFNQKSVSDALDLDLSQIRLLSPFVGGGFGSKLGIAPEAIAAALASKAVGRPVSVAMHRRQVFETTTHRSATKQKVRLAADKDGKLIGVGHDNLVYNLPGEKFSEPTTQATPFTYAGENRVIGHHIARLHRPAAGSVRAPGEAVGATVFEMAMDEMAEKLDLDPIEFRVRNIPDLDPSKGIPFSENRMEAVLRDGAERFGWKHTKPKQRLEDGWWIGTGVAAAVRVNMMSETSARVRLTQDGAVVETDMTDIGTGTYAILTQVAGELLGLPANRVETRLGDSDFPKAFGSGGSVGASSSGTAVYLACMELRQNIAAALGVEETDLTLKDGRAISGNVAKPLTEIVPGEGWSATGTVKGGKAGSLVRQATWGSCFAEVAVNAVTGETRVRRMLGSFAAGRILNEKTAKSQCIGGMTWGLGMALHEELVHDPRDGHMVNRDLAEYHVPANLDVPQIEAHLLMEDRDDWANPVQAKGIGELGISGTGAAVINAIYNACGVRIRSLPGTLDKILAELP